MTQVTRDMSKKQRLIIIGGGMSGTKFATEIAERTDKYNITLFNKEATMGYNRIMLSPVLAGEKRLEDILLHPRQWYVENNVDLRLDEKVDNIDATSHSVTTQYGAYEYDKLVIATGSNPFILPLPNHQAEGVVAFRDITDVDTMLSYAQSTDKNRCVVIGAGLLGLEAANALNNHGAQVSVVHIADSILGRQLNDKAASLLQKHFEAKGITFCLEHFSEEILVDANNHVTGLTFKDGTHIDADMIVMAVGVRPNIELAQTSGITCERGIVVDEFMRTASPDIYALGECTQFDGHLFGLVAPTYEQAMVIADQLAGARAGEQAGDDKETKDTMAAEPFSVKPTATKLKVSGVNLFSAGDISDNDIYEYLEYEDYTANTYKRISLHNNRIVGAVMYGDVMDGTWFFDLINSQQDISSVRHNLLFGQAFCEFAEESDLTAEARA